MRQNHPRPNSAAPLDAGGRGSTAKSKSGEQQRAKPSAALPAKTKQATKSAKSKLAPLPPSSPDSAPRYDRPGHLEDSHAARLLQLSRRRSSREERGFIFGSAASDDLAEELAEQAVSSMVGAGETWLDMVNAPVEEEEGGPFLESPGAREFAAGSEDETEGFLREALPTAIALRFEPEGVSLLRRRRR